MKKTQRLFAASALALCCAAAYAAPPTGAKLADQAITYNSRFTLTAPTSVSYGVDTRWHEQVLPAGTHTCADELFTADPAFGSVKACFLTGAPAPVITWSKISDEFWSFTLSQTTDVRMGLNGNYYTKRFTAGTYPCTVDSFDGQDKAPGVAKVCEAASALSGGTTPTNPTNPTTPTNPPVTSNDVATPEAYRARIATLGTDAWFTYKYGSPSTKARTTVTWPAGPSSKSMSDLSSAHNPKKVFPDGVEGGRACGNWTGAWCGEYQFGTLMGWPGDYSSSIANIAYVPDVPVTAGFRENKYWGVASLQVLNVGHNTVSWKPEPSWTTWIDPNANNADNDENTLRFAGVRGGSPIGSTTLDAKPVAAARGFGRGGWVNNVITVWANGEMTTAGSNTSHNFARLKLPAEFKPTAIAITNSGEFALVAGWNPGEFKGQVAVVALADGCQWCEDKPESQWNPNWGSGRGAYPGMPGLGNYLGMKLIGFVDLPASIKAPTDIAVTTGKDKRYDNGYERVQQLWVDNMLTSANRARWYNGELKGAMARTGLAMVTSKSESTAAVIDLRPLFMGFREQYVAPMTDAQWNAKIANRGQADNQFPVGFTTQPSQKPVVVKEITLTSRPTAVRMMPNAPQRAILATEDGNVHLYGLGSKYLDQNAALVGVPSDIVELSAINVGANPTSIAHVDEKARLDQGKSYLWGDTTPDEMFWWVNSREERKQSLLRLNSDATAFTVFKALEDSRVADPILVLDGTNHGMESYILSIGDYNGKALHSFGYGPMIMWTYDNTAPCTKTAPCGPTDRNGFMYAGKHSLPGKPFNGGIANIN